MNKTLFYFNQITKIPRPSGYEKDICSYLQNFAKERNLECFVDNTFNVIIKKQSNSQKDKTLILQAHSDMVCEKEPSSNINFYKDGITTITEGDFLKADRTTLGADNGVGLSMILSILDDTTLQIPNLECVFTTQEETTMLGAINLNTTLLKGKHLLSIDGTDEGKIEVSSAGMTVFEAQKTYNTDYTQNNINEKTKVFEISLTGFRGGHSGSEIDSGKLNAIKVMGKFLTNFKDKLNFVKITAGNKSNAIPRDFSCIVLAQDLTKITLENVSTQFLNDYLTIEPNAKIIVKELEKNSFYNKTFSSLNNLQTINLIDFITNYQNGVLSKNNQNFVVSSNNLASIHLENGNLKIVVSLRSSNK